VIDDEFGAIAILDEVLVHDDGQKEFECVHDGRALPPVDFISRVIAAGPLFPSS
jgi:hypothetical protein